MELYTFTRTEARRGQANSLGRPVSRRTLSFRGQRIYLSTLLSMDLGLKAGAHVAFTYDEDRPERVYIRPADYPDDTKEIQMKLSAASKRVLQCYNKAVVKHVLTFAEATEGCTCYVAAKPTKINGKDHYQILVSNPININ